MKGYLVGAVGLLMLSGIIGSKATNTEPAKAFMKGKVINPWEDDSKLDVHPS